MRSCNNAIETEATLCSRNGSPGRRIRRPGIGELLRVGDRSLSQERRKLRARLSDDRNAQNLFKRLLGNVTIEEFPPGYFFVVKSVNCQLRPSWPSLVSLLKSYAILSLSSFFILSMKKLTLFSDIFSLAAIPEGFRDSSLFNMSRISSSTVLNHSSKRPLISGVASGAT